MHFMSQNKRRPLVLLAFLFAFLEIFGIEETTEKPLVVLITSYNNEKYVQMNLLSALTQKYSNYRIIYVNDCSTDQTTARVASLLNLYPHKKKSFSYVKNRRRMGALANIYQAVHRCRDDEIIVSLDGDDWFPHSLVLQRLNEAYASSDVWLTHGSFIEYPNNSTAWSIPVPKEFVNANNFRSYRCPSHLRTFYAWLFKQIRREDLLYQGEFFPMTWDQAMMFPMIEMAGERHRFLPEILYVYNVANELNDNKVNAQLQTDLEKHIRSLPCYARLEGVPQ